MQINIQEAVRQLLDTPLDSLQLLGKEELNRLRKHLGKALKGLSESGSGRQDPVKSLFSAIESGEGWKKVEELNEDRIEGVFNTEFEDNTNHLALAHIERFEDSTSLHLYYVLTCWCLHKECQAAKLPSNRRWYQERFPKEKWSTVKNALRQGKVVAMIAKRPCRGIVLMMSRFPNIWKNLTEKDVEPITDYHVKTPKVMEFSNNISPFVLSLSARYDDIVKRHNQTTALSKSTLRTWETASMPQEIESSNSTSTTSTMTHGTANQLAASAGESNTTLEDTPCHNSGSSGNMSSSTDSSSTRDVLVTAQSSGLFSWPNCELH